MRWWFSLAGHSAWHRRFGLSLVLLSVALSAFLLMGVERVRADVRQHFASAVSGTDLVVGPRTGAVQLLLYSVFRMGQPTQGMRWHSVQAVERDPAVAWVVPLSLGDSYRGFPVVGTSAAYFEHFRHGDARRLAFEQGRAFAGVFEAVPGHEVARRLGLRVGDTVVLSHGSGALPGQEHADKPFVVTGILQRTGTPVDRSLHIGLAGMEALHLDWVGGVPLPGMAVPAARVQEHDLTPTSVTAVLVGLKQRAQVFGVQRRIAAYAGEPLMAVLPGVVLDELWDVVGAGEQALRVLSALVAVVSLAGLGAVIVAGLEQRRRELAVLRSVGCGPRRLFLLLLLESTLVAGLGAALGAALSLAAVAAAGPWLALRYGVELSLSWPDAQQWRWLAAVGLAGTLAGVLPAWRAYRLSLSDGLQPRG